MQASAVGLGWTALRFTSPRSWRGADAAKAAVDAAAMVRKKSRRRTLSGTLESFRNCTLNTPLKDGSGTAHLKHSRNRFSEKEHYNPSLRQVTSGKQAFRIVEAI
jgi:hypothetical protein